MNNHQCPICLSEEVLFQLPCKHSFCQDCLNTQIEELIKAKISSKLCCAQCNQQFNIVQIQDILQKDVFNQFNSVLIKAGEVECSNQYEKFIQCDYDGCHGCFIINEGIQIIVCPVCQKELCVKCYKQCHPNYTCEQAKDMKDKDNQIFIENAKKMGYAQCPKCKIMVEKTKGCNFMYCQNKKCNSYFCYQCGQLLDKSQHYSHYEKRDPFNGACVDLKQDLSETNRLNSLFNQMVQAHQNPNDPYLQQIQDKYRNAQMLQKIYQRLGLIEQNQQEQNNNNNNNNNNNGLNYQELLEQQQIEIAMQNQLAEQRQQQLDRQRQFELQQLEAQKRLEKLQEQALQNQIRQEEQRKLDEQKQIEEQKRLEKEKSYTCQCGKVFFQSNQKTKFERCFKCNKKIFCHNCILFFDISSLISHKCVK